jgi:hypothetical protein
MTLHSIAGAAFRALTARKDGPSLYDVCDPLLLKYTGGDPHLGKFYRTALGNPALRPLLRRTGLSELRDEPTLWAARGAGRARDQPSRTGPRSAPVADLIASSCIPAEAIFAGARAGRIEADPRCREVHLLKPFSRNAYSDPCRLQPDRRPDLRGREMRWR